MSPGRIADDEVLYRCIRPGKSWFEPPDRITSANFKLRAGERGISVYRAIIVDAADVLKKLEAIAGSVVAETTAGKIREIQNSEGKALGLEVIPVDDENDPGHAEIRHSSGRISSGAAKALSKLFRLIESPPKKSQ